MREIKYYGMGPELIANGDGERITMPGIVECPDGGYVKREDYENLQSSLIEEIQLLTHKVITCGVAASHPDINLSRVGAYAGKWNSAQADGVRELRDKYEAVRTALEDLVKDLEMRSTWKLGEDKGVVDCGNGVYLRAKTALGHLE